jgi:hypothetical protein
MQDHTHSSVICGQQLAFLKHFNLWTVFRAPPPVECFCMRVRVVYVPVLLAFLSACAAAPEQPTTALMRPKAVAIAAPPSKPKPETSARGERCATDDQIKSIIILASRATYHRGTNNPPCACADDVKESGKKCAGQSAEVRASGQRPYCKGDQISPEMVAEARASTGLMPCRG